jgi:hypothetical protein
MFSAVLDFAPDRAADEVTVMEKLQAEMTKGLNLTYYTDNVES